MKIAVVGCLHGKLDQVYKDVADSEKRLGFLIDLVVVCGDFQAVRGVNDLECVAIPSDQKELGEFHAYYMKKKHATYMTLVIGGNTEASNYFQTLPYGGWIANNIYYLGYSNVVKMNGVRIAGISGVFNSKSTDMGHYESLPYNRESIKTAYHTRYLEVYRMLQVKEQIDVMLTHDWPSHIFKMPGCLKYLISQRKSLKTRIDQNCFGSPLYEYVLNKIRPRHWFAAHLHIQFRTSFVHDCLPNTSAIDASQKCIKDPISNTTPSQTNEKQQVTHFLALDKCSPGKNYLEIVHVASDEFNIDGLEYDLEWLAILQLTNEYMSTQQYPSNKPPSLDHEKFYPDLNERKQKIKEALKNNLKIPTNFTINLPYNLEGHDVDPKREKNYINDQTTRFCEILKLTDPIQNILDRNEGRVQNPDRIDIDDDGDLDWKESEVASVDWVIDNQPDVYSSNNDYSSNKDYISICNNEQNLNLVDSDPMLAINQVPCTTSTNINGLHTNETCTKLMIIDDQMHHDQIVDKEGPCFFIDTKGAE